MNILFLVNSSPELRPLLLQISSQIKENNNVVYVLDSRLSDFIYPDYKINDKKYYFTDYLKSNFNNELKNKDYLKYNIWESFYSDYDRFEHLGLNKNKDNHYFIQVMTNLLNFFDEIIEKENIDVVIYENVSNSFVYSCYTVLKHKNKKFMGIYSSKLPGRFEIHSDDRGCEDFKKIYDKVLNGKIKITKKIDNYISEYINNFDKKVPDGVKSTITIKSDFSFTKRYFNKERLKELIILTKYTLNNKKEIPFAYQVDNPYKIIFASMKRSFFRKLKLKVIKNYYDKVNKEDNYYLYPLHYHPESSTSVYAKQYNDELHSIIQMAFNIPFGSYLYVKDHPDAAGLPELSFYQKLKKVPNIKLISHKENTKQLIKNSQGVIVLTGTVGFESLILDKPVFVLGDIFFKYHKNARVINFDNMFDVISNYKKSEEDYLTVTKEFLYAYYLWTHEGVYLLKKGGIYADMVEVFKKEIEKINR